MYSQGLERDTDALVRDVPEAGRAENRSHDKELWDEILVRDQKQQKKRMKVIENQESEDE